MPSRNLGDNLCDDEANNEACEFDRGDCCLSGSESKKYCTECLCKKMNILKSKDSKYTGENCGKREGERGTSFSFNNGPSVTAEKVNIKQAFL